MLRFLLEMVLITFVTGTILHHYAKELLFKYDLKKMLIKKIPDEKKRKVKEKRLKKMLFFAGLLFKISKYLTLGVFKLGKNVIIVNENMSVEDEYDDEDGNAEVFIIAYLQDLTDEEVERARAYGKCTLILPMELFEKERAIELDRKAREALKKEREREEVEYEG